MARGYVRAMYNHRLVITPKTINKVAIGNNQIEVSETHDAPVANNFTISEFRHLICYNTIGRRPSRKSEQTQLSSSSIKVLRTWGTERIRNLLYHTIRRNKRRDLFIVNEAQFFVMKSEGKSSRIHA